MKKYKTLLILIILLLVCYYTSTNLIQFQLIQGNSMAPSYKNWQFVLINRNPQSLQNGDVITFYSPGLNATLIKRIVASPGDNVLISNNTLYVNNIPSPYATNTAQITYAGIAENNFTLESNQYFVLGDNYDESIDSRYPEVGCVLKEHILGTVFPQVSLSNN